MTLTERKTRFEIIFKLKGKTSEEVVDKFNKMKQFVKNNYNKIFKSILNKIYKLREKINYL